MYIHGTMSYTVLDRTSNEAFQALWIELQFRSSVIFTVMSFIDNIILWIVF